MVSPLIVYGQYVNFDVRCRGEPLVAPRTLVPHTSVCGVDVLVKVSLKAEAFSTLFALVVPLLFVNRFKVPPQVASGYKRLLAIETFALLYFSMNSPNVSL